MALTRSSRLIVVFGASFVLLALMMASVDPEVQYSVDQVMDDPERFENSDVFVRGVVAIDSMNHQELVFVLEGSTQQLIVDFSESPVPDGFDEGRTIAVRGLLSLIEGSWVIDSYEIQTGCPSKYES